MGSDMSRQMVRPRKLPHTNPTLEGLLSCVDSHMASELIATGKRPVTILNGALIRPVNAAPGAGGVLRHGEFIALFHMVGGRTVSRVGAGARLMGHPVIAVVIQGLGFWFEDTWSRGQRGRRHPDPEFRHRWLLILRIYFLLDGDFIHNIRTLIIRLADDQFRQLGVPILVGQRLEEVFDDGGELEDGRGETGAGRIGRDWRQRQGRCYTPSEMNSSRLGGFPTGCTGRLLFDCRLLLGCCRRRGGTLRRVAASLYRLDLNIPTVERLIVAEESLSREGRLQPVESTTTGLLSSSPAATANPTAMMTGRG